jgi:hypothetical protein
MKEGVRSGWSGIIPLYLNRSLSSGADVRKRGRKETEIMIRIMRMRKESEAEA